VLELVPSEIERLMIPVPDELKANVQKLDKLVRHSSMEDAIKTNGKDILGKLGISADQQSVLLESWRALRNRRHRISSKVDGPYPES